MVPKDEPRGVVAWMPGSRLPERLVPMFSAKAMWGKPMVARRPGSRLAERLVPMGWFGLTWVLVWLGLTPLGLARFGCPWLGLAWLGLSWCCVLPLLGVVVAWRLGSRLPERLVPMFSADCLGFLGGS